MCVLERGRDREISCVFERECVCACVCMRERESGWESDRPRTILASGVETSASEIPGSARIAPVSTCAAM